MQEAITVPIQLLSENARTPSRAYVGDAGYDLYASAFYTLKPFERCLIDTGVALEIPAGYGGFVLPRSGLAIKKGLSLVNAPGLIDSNYRGEIKVIAINLDPHKDIEIQPGDRIAQVVIMNIEDVNFSHANVLSDSIRGEGGFGSSGVSEA